jgi:electron transport complex protein RnfA
MNTGSPLQIFIDACLINNFVLSLFLGICPFLGVSGKLDTAVRMGAAVAFVMLVSSVCAFGIHNILEAINAPYLHLISYIVVIASAVQLVEMFIKRFSPALFRALGIFLPLITTNCAILGVALFQTNRQYNFVQSLSFALGAGAGFMLALLLMSGLRERLELSDVSSVVRGAALTLMIAGILSMAFMGFAGMGGGG